MTHVQVGDEGPPATDAERRELELWRQVFGPATLAQLEHLAGSLHCNCNPVCGHEEDYCAEYDRLAG